jgi:hypothetical protein
MQSTPIVKYSGIFTDAQKQAIGRMATRVETQCDMDPVPVGFGARWLAVAREVSRDRRLFIASRIGASDVIVGETVSELIDQIRTTFVSRKASSERLEA